jgi:segregation and condensation protein A
VAAQTAAWTVHTDVFEGPLDLLLYLVRRDGVDLARLRVSAICDAYLDYLDRMRSLRLNVAADYLVMAATLVHLKSLSLLPRAPTSVTEDGEEEDPAEALAQRLLEYQRYKEAAEALHDRPMVGRDVFVREGEGIDTADRPVTAGIDAFGLLELYYGLLQQAAAPEPTHHLAAKGPDLAQCCEHVIAALQLGGGRGDLAAILRGFADRGSRVIAFVAVLEMARLGWIDVQQDAHLGPVQVAQIEGAAVDLNILTGRMAAGEEVEEAHVP